MKGYLITYIDPGKNDGHHDPILEEFTYGDINGRGRILRTKLEKGDFLFFHTNIKNRRVITAYYYVESVMTTKDAQNDLLITSKYNNPHLKKDETDEFDTIVFGNTVYSKVLRHPLEINKEILESLSKKPKSIDRPWLSLNDKDIKYLISMINKYEEEGYLKDTYLSTNEIEQLQEIDIENFLQDNPKIFGESITLFKRQYVLKSGKRLDLLLKDTNTNELVVVEIKKESIGKEAYKQINGYMNEIHNEFSMKTRGIIICSDILAAYEDFIIEKVNKKSIEIFFYCWKFHLRSFKS